MQPQALLYWFLIPGCESQTLPTLTPLRSPKATISPCADSTSLLPQQPLVRGFRFFSEDGADPAKSPVSVHRFHILWCLPQHPSTGIIPLGSALHF